MFTCLAWGAITGAGISSLMGGSPAVGLIMAGVLGLFASLAKEKAS